MLCVEGPMVVLLICFPPSQVILHYLVSFSCANIMASSQKDMFTSSSPESSPRVESSLPEKLTYVYLWIILFDWNGNVEFPFNLYQAAMFDESELKPQWLNGDLDQQSRMKKMKFTAIKGKTFSLFAKVERCKLNIFFIIIFNLVTFLTLTLTCFQIQETER